MSFTHGEINNIVNLIGANGERIDIFNLHFVLHIGNVKDKKWNLEKDGQFTFYAEHSISVHPFRFDDCNTPDEVRTEFSQVVYEALKEAL